MFSTKFLFRKIMPLFVALTVVLSAVFLAPVKDAEADVLCDPQIGVQLNLGEIRAWCFQPEATVILTIDDPGTTQNPDYSASGTVPTGDYPMIIFHYELEPGYIIEASDGVTTRQLIFQPVGISEINTQYNTVSGTAVPLSSVIVTVRLLSGDWLSRGAFSDIDGKWVVDFNDPNYYGGAVDLQNGMPVDVTQYDSDYDGATYERRILPRVNVNVERSSYESFGWAENVLVTLEVDDPTNEVSPDCTYTETAWGDSVSMSLYQTGCSAKAGDIVMIKGNGVSTSHEVKLLEITQVDVINDILRGIADKDQKIYLDMQLSGKRIKAETMSDANGNWQFDFSAMTPPVDLVLEYDQGIVYIKDANGNSTVAKFYLDPPNMLVDLSTNTVYGYGFQLGDTVTLTVDDPSTGNAPDFQASLKVEDLETKIIVDPSLRIMPGFVIKMFDSASIRQLVVWSLSVTSVDLVNDRVTGVTSLPGSLWVDIYEPSTDWVWLGFRYVSSDENGNWMADFGDPNADPYGDGMTVDIQPGFMVSVSQQDDDYDLLFNNDWIIPTNLPPVADAGGPYSAFSGETITLDASGSSDPDGDLLTYEWDLDNDGEYDDAVGVTTDVSFLEIGSLTVGLRVTDTGGLSDADRAEVTVIPLPIKIDIKPGSYPNPINLKSKGIIPVAVLTTDEFDAGELDLATVTFAGASPLRWAWQDVDWDGDMDLLFHFDTLKLNLDKNSVDATLIGKTITGMSVMGIDTVKIVSLKYP